MLEIDDLSLSLSTYPVIRGVSLHVERGSLMCLLGPSGCGKTTLLRCIAGLEVPERGTISIAGRPVSDPKRFVPPQQRNIGFLFQDFALFPHLSVSANVAYGLTDVAKNERQQRVAQMLEQTHMTEHAEKYPHMLSGGQQQRVALARALAPKPALMLLDEPFSDLDTSMRGRVRAETLEILTSAGLTAIMVTHDPQEAMLMADRVALMRDGRIVQVGTPEELYRFPIDAFAASFFGEVNRFGGVVENGSVRTSLGCFESRGHAEGERLDVYIRPDAVTVGGQSCGFTQHAPVSVCSIRFAGSRSVVQLGLGDDEEPHRHIEARLDGMTHAKIGDKVDISIDPDQTYLFKSSK